MSAQGPVPIEAVELGDMVLSRDAATGEQAMRPVTELYRNKTTELIHVDIGQETISATPEHPFWVQGIGWVDASGLSAGDDLLLADGGTATIVSVMRERLESPRDVYNFEVEGFHTYFVASAGVWVHNACAAKWGTHLHHIVAKSAPRAEKSRAVLRRFGINVNSLDNMVRLTANRKMRNVLGTNVHSTLHTKRYYEYVDVALGKAKTKKEAQAVLAKAKRMLQSGKHPF